MSFEGLGLSPELLRAVEAQGYTTPTPVQAESIPLVLAGRDLLAGAQTGTGKTAAFVLPILQLLNAKRPEPRPAAPGNARLRGATGLPIRCLVLTPTRELALQIEESVRTYGAQRPVRSTTIYGGVGFQPQVNALRHGPEIVVATPGRLLDHAGQGTIDLRSVEILVLDEADRMLDMGFIRDIRRVLELIPHERQNLLFSATFSDEIRELADTLLVDPAHVQIAARNAPIELVRQVVYPVDRERKRELLSHLISSGRIDRALVFTRTKHGANRLAEQLEMDGIKANAIHGNKSQSQRVHALDDFKSGRVAVLVATEVASRGIDIDGLPHVVNYELPMVASDYVHRIGRTGRAGMEGDAVSLVCVDEQGLLRDIETLLRQPIAREVVPGFEVDRSIRPEPILRRSNGGRPMRQMPARGAAPRPMAPRPMAPRPMPERTYGERPAARQAERPYAERPAARQAEIRPMPAARPVVRPAEISPMPERSLPERFAAVQRPYGRQPAARPAPARPAPQYGRTQSSDGYAAPRRPMAQPPRYARPDPREAANPGEWQPGGNRPTANRPGPRPVQRPDSRPAVARPGQRPGPSRTTQARPGTGFGNGYAARPAPQNRSWERPNTGRGNGAAPSRPDWTNARNHGPSPMPGERFSRADERAG